MSQAAMRIMAAIQELIGTMRTNEANNNDPTSWGDTRDTVMVIGGGVAGMRAAVDLAEAGLRVCLVEAAPALGGRVAQYHSRRRTSIEGSFATRERNWPRSLIPPLPRKWYGKTTFGLNSSTASAAAGTSIV